MIGRQLGGRYEILVRVGGGGMAIVYKALDILLHRHVAVKVLRPQYVHDEEFIERFRREAQAAASLSHSNVVSIYDVGQEEDVHYIVMEYIEGTTLNELIKEKAPLQVEEAVLIASQICEALEHAHHNQIIHRDIKPHNILIGKNGRVKVTDFGIARAVTSTTITQTGSVLGSVHYFSPEHAKGTITGVQSDLYSLGIVMYQMLTGKLPFIGDSPISVALKHLQEKVEDPRKVNPLIPQSVENIILRSVRKNPSDRYVSASQMMEDLDSCLQPNRRNEAKLSFIDIDEMDEEKTRVIPAIRPGQYVPMDDDDDDGPHTFAGPGVIARKRNSWIKSVIWIVVLLGLLGFMWYMVDYVKAKMVVQTVSVPNVVSKPLSEAQDTLKNAHLDYDVIMENSKDVPKDVVISQSSANINVKVNTKVTLHVSKGVELQKMPSLIGSNLADAKTTLIAMGFKEDKISTDQKSADGAPGTVLLQTPPANEALDPLNSSVKLTVSKGKETFKMKDLVGLTEAEAKSRITIDNLKLTPDGINYETSYKQPKGRVITQFPYLYNEDVSPGSEIKLIVSSGLPEEAGSMKVSVPYKPTAEGKATTIKISLTDAQFDNFEVKSIPNVTKPGTVDINLVVSPVKSATIKIKQENDLSDMITVTYQDYQAQKNGKPFNPVPAASPSTPGSTNANPSTPANATTTPGTGTSGSGAGTGTKPGTPAATPSGTPSTGAGAVPGTPGTGTSTQVPGTGATTTPAKLKQTDTTSTGGRN